MDGLRRTALVLLVLLPMLMIVGCGGDDDEDQGLIAFQSGDPASPNIVLMNADGSNQQLVTANGMDAALRPDGQAIAFARGRDIFLINANGTGLTNLTNNGLGVVASNPAFNAQGTRIAYVLTATAPGSPPAIRVMDADGNNDTELVTPGDEPAFSPDGNQIVYANGQDLFLIPADGMGAPTLLTSNAAGDVVSNPSFSPLGDRVVFAFQEDAMDTTPTLRFVNVTSKAETDLVDNGAQPVFSPFADRVVFVRGGAIFSIRTDGTDLRQLTVGPTDAQPSWSLGL